MAMLIDEALVVEIKIFVVIESICQARLRMSSSINTSQTRMFERGDGPPSRLHRWSFSRSLRRSIHHLSTNSGIGYSSMPDDGLPAYGTPAPSRPAQQTPQTLLTIQGRCKRFEFKVTEGRCCCDVG